MRTSLASALLLLLAGCQLDGGGGTPISGDSRNVGDVTLTLRIEPARVKVGDPVRLTLRLFNNSGRERSLTYPSGQRYDFWVSKGDRKVWRWSEGKAFTQAIVTEALPGQTGKPYTEVWRPDVPGAYRAHAVLTADGYRDPLTGPVTVG